MQHLWDKQPLSILSKQDRRQLPHKENVEIVHAHKQRRPFLQD